MDVINRQPCEQDAGVFNFNAFVEQRNPDRRALLGVVRVYDSVNQQSRTARPRSKCAGCSDTRSAFRRSAIAGTTTSTPRATATPDRFRNMLRGIRAATPRQDNDAENDHTTADQRFASEDAELLESRCRRHAIFDGFAHRLLRAGFFQRAHHNLHFEFSRNDNHAIDITENEIARSNHHPFDLNPAAKIA